MIPTPLSFEHRGIRWAAKVPTEATFGHGPAAPPSGPPVWRIEATGHAPITGPNAMGDLDPLVPGNTEEDIIAACRAAIDRALG